MGNPDYVQERIERARQRALHHLQRAPDCQCPDCLSSQQWEARVRERLEAQRAANGEPPF